MNRLSINLRSTSKEAEDGLKLKENRNLRLLLRKILLMIISLTLILYKSITNLNHLYKNLNKARVFLN